MRKVLLCVLIAVNVVLLLGLVVTVFKPQDASAQPVPLSGNYLMVSGEILGTTTDAVYLLNLGTRQLHAMTYDKNTRELRLVGTRDLSRDLGGAVPAIGPTPGRYGTPTKR
jgi:hypothetical protein